MTNINKAKYESPILTVIGSFEQVTNGTTSGAQTDAVLPRGTPVSDIPGFISTHLS
jgi:hypothetical protein